METYKVIYDFEEIKKMIDLFPDLNQGEVFFLSLSARKKYLDESERSLYQLNRAEMFNRTIVREKTYNKFYKLMRRMETNIEGFQTKQGLPYPTKCISTYININPSDMLLANAEHQRKLIQYNYELTRALLNGNKCDALMKKFSKLDVEFMNCIQRSRGQKKFIDIDFDIDKITEYFILCEYIKFLKENNIIYHVIETKNGYHVLMERATIHCNYNAEVKRLHKLVENEVVVNVNEMCPCPGTLAGNFPIKFVEI